ncbi:MAG: SRPBCC family protein [Deltaproteobacteria bacterium]|nr:SRPBCC family protein [Deltaproteobacteria bacterium]
MLRSAVAVVVVVLFVLPARADEIGDMIKAGPLVRIETDPKTGKLKQSVCITDVAAPIDAVWKVLVDYPTYKFFMPRIDKIDVVYEGKDALVSIKLDTPLVSTSYTNRMTADLAAHTINVKNEQGDLSGSRYFWRLVPLGDLRTRIFYSGLIKNYSSMAESFEDEQQTLSIGINVVSLLATAKAVKDRSELLHQQALAKAAPTTTTPAP